MPRPLGNVSRTEAREYICPACRAGFGRKCTSTRGKLREAVHRERMNLALAERRLRES